MESKLSKIEFRERIINNTKIGSPLLKLSPFGFLSFFGDPSKTFYGNFDDSVFRLTMNSTLSPTFYILKGKYKTVKGKLNIDYAIEPSSKFQLIWIKYFPIFAMVLVNCIFLANKKTLTEYIPFNLFIVFILFYSRWNAKRKMKNLERTFNEIFEVIV